MAPVGPAGPDRRPLGAPGVRGRVRYRSTWRATRSAPGLVLRGLLTAPLLALSLFYGWMLERASISVLGALMAFGFGLMLLVSGILLPALWERTAVPYVDEEQDHRDRIACEFRADRRSAGTVLGHEASAGPLARRPPSPEPPDPTAGR